MQSNSTRRSSRASVWQRKAYAARVSTFRPGSRYGLMVSIRRVLAKIGWLPSRSVEPEPSLEPFFQSLAEAIIWCRLRRDVSSPQSCLRGPPFGTRATASIDEEFVAAVVAWRRAEVGAVPASSSVEEGRLLVYFPDANLCDGAAEVESEGFLDVENSPPWGTWVGLFHKELDDGRGYGRYLVAWVPPEFLPHASSGIAVNPEECILWLQASELPLKRRLAL